MLLRWKIGSHVSVHAVGLYVVGSLLEFEILLCFTVLKANKLKQMDWRKYTLLLNIIYLFHLFLVFELPVLSKLHEYKWMFTKCFPPFK